MVKLVLSSCRRALFARDGNRTLLAARFIVDEIPAFRISSRFYLGHKRMTRMKSNLSEDSIEDFREHDRFLDAVHKDPFNLSGVGRSPEQRRILARELSFEADECPDVIDAIRLWLRAIRLDPAQLDARVLLAMMADGPRDELIEELEQIVRTGEDDLGPQFFRENKGLFWGVIDARPYMRARAALAQELRAAHRFDQAIAHYEAMLDLNPNDNQGLRYLLLGCYLEAGKLEAARNLLQRYDEASAFMLWARVLERFLSGNLAEAASALREARRNNSYVEDYLTGKKKLPKTLPEAYSPGDVTEAMACCAEMGEAWRSRKHAIAWLKKDPREEVLQHTIH